MEPLLCQCCGLSFSPKARGTNRDLTRNSDYCIKCYNQGFFQHHMSLGEMEKKLLVMARRHQDITMEEAHETLRILPDLKRWKRTHIL